MAANKLMLDDVFENVSFSLIAIHCAIEDYRLAFLLNNILNISLIRKQEDLDFDEGFTKYAVFECEDLKKLITWNLIANICKIEVDSKMTPQTLFSENYKVVRHYNLIPEHKKVNYFLKISQEFSKYKEKHIINNILKIPQVVLAYTINSNVLKSKDNLIFD